jgi:hypothetical protein
VREIEREIEGFVLEGREKQKRVTQKEIIGKSIQHANTVHEEQNNVDSQKNNN